MNFGKLRSIEIKCTNLKGKEKTLYLNLENENISLVDIDDFYSEFSRYRIYKYIEVITDRFKVNVKASNGNIKINIGQRFSRLLVSLIDKNCVELKEIIPVGSIYNKDHTPYKISRDIDNIWRFGVYNKHTKYLEAERPPLNYLQYVIDSEIEKPMYNQSYSLFLNFENNPPLNNLRGSETLIKIVPSKETWSMELNNNKTACIIYDIDLLEKEEKK